MLTITGCTFSNSYGECIGFDDEKDPALNYDLDTGNIIIGVLLVEMVIPPIVVALEAAYCPTGPAHHIRQDQ